MKERPIGVFDSGVGGISVLKKAVKILPEENFVYFGDSINAPYGEKDIDEVRGYIFDVAKFLVEEKNVKAIVVACNTATSIAIKALRDKYKDIPVIGIEPAIKPATEQIKGKPIFIMATPITLRESKLDMLIERYNDDAEIIKLPCPGLAELIEEGEIHTLSINKYLVELFNPYKRYDIGAIVLGCTHYPFIKEDLYAVVGKEVSIIDGAEGTAMQLKRKLEEYNLRVEQKKEGSIEIYNSKEERLIELSKKLLKV